MKVFWPTKIEKHMECVRESADASIHKVIDSIIKSTAGYTANGEVARIPICIIMVL